MNESSADSLNSRYLREKRRCSETLCKIKSTSEDYTASFCLRNVCLEETLLTQTRASLFRITAIDAVANLRVLWK